MRPNFLFGGTNQLLDIGFLRDVGLRRRYRRPILATSFGARAVEVSDDQRLGAFLVKALRQRLADAAGCACDDDDLVANLHPLLPRNCSSLCVVDTTAQWGGPWRRSYGGEAEAVAGA